MLLPVHICYLCTECGKETCIHPLTHALYGDPDECKHCGAVDFREPEVY